MMYGLTYAATSYGGKLGRVGFVLSGAVMSITKGIKRIMGVVGTKQ